MTTLTLQIENPSILAQLKDALKAFRGVKIIDSVNNAYSSVKAQEEIPNSVTLSAMKEIESGKDAGPGQSLNKKGNDLNTITLDSGIYNSVAAYARLHNMSVSEAVKTGMQVFLEIIGKNNVATSRPKYYINPKVKALEMGFQCPDDLSLDYKKELAEILEEKYL